MENTHRWLLGFIIVVYLVLAFFTVKDVVSIPSCIRGCDSYFENGITLDLINNPSHMWQSSSHDWLNYTSSLPKFAFYPRVLLSELGMFHYFDSWKVVLVESLILIIIGVLAWYFLYKRLFKSNYLAIVLMLVSFTLGSFPYFKYSSIINILLPILILLIMNFYESEDNYSCIWLLLILIIFSNIQAMSLFIAYFLLGFGYLYYRRKFWLTFIVSVLSISITILLGWWYQVLFVFKGDTNPYKFDIFGSLNSSNNFIHYTVVWIKELFLNTGSMIGFIASIIILVGLVYWAMRRGIRIINWLVPAILFSVFNYIITVPILHMQLSPSHAIAFLSPLLAGLCLGVIIINLKGKFQVMFMLGVAILLFSGNILQLELNSRSGYSGLGLQQLPPQYSSLQQWYLDNHISPSDTVLLSSNELSFTLHGVTGTKLLVGRQSHFFHFGDFQKLWQDAAVIYYGNDTKLRHDLLLNYSMIAKSANKTLYLYWDDYWVIGDYNNATPYDPFRFEYSQDREDYLNAQGIKYFINKSVYFEPSSEQGATKLDIIYVSKDNYVSDIHPWSTNLDQYLTEVWRYNDTARLYKVKVD
jgi:hypothetical protein